MKQDSIFTSFNLLMLPIKGNAIIFNDGLFLLDTFRTEVTPDHDEWKNHPYPYKIEFSIAIFCLKGQIDIRLNLVEYQIRANDMLIAKTGSIGEFLGISNDCQVFIIALTDNFYPTDRFLEYIPPILSILNRNPVIHLSEKEFSEFRNIYCTLYEKLSDDDFDLKKEISSNYINIMFCLLYQSMQKSASKSSKASDKRKVLILEQFIELVQKNCTTRRDLQFYADKLCLSPKYMSQVIYKSSGQHASLWIRDFVILEAKALLKSGKYSVQQIADKLNFSNASFFGKYFKAATGMTPRKYQYNK